MQHDRDQGARTEASPLALVSQTTVSAFEEARESFERFCLAAGIEAMEALLEEEATSICGQRYGRDADRAIHRWGATMSPVGFHCGKVGIRRPRLRGKEVEGEADAIRTERAVQDKDVVRGFAETKHRAGS